MLTTLHLVSLSPPVAANSPSYARGCSRQEGRFLRLAVELCETLKTKTRYILEYLKEKLQKLICKVVTLKYLAKIAQAHLTV